MQFRADDIFLGSGGNSPGLDVLRAGQIQSLVNLPAGHSAYAIDLAPEGNVLAVGSKMGFVYRFEPNADDAPLTLPDPLFQGAPVISNCFVDGLGLFVGDVMGRCLYWEGPDAAQPRVIYEGQAVICALIRLGRDRMAGLSSRGELMVWDGQGKLLDRMSVPAPPPALVRLHCWPTATTLVWPGQGGRLVLADLQSREVSQVAAHEGSFQAMAVRGEELTTIGYGDDLIKCWRADGTCERAVTTGRRGAIAAAAVRDMPEDLLLLRNTGEAELCSLADALRRRVIRAPAGRIYRSIWTADEAMWVSLQRQRRARAADAIVLRMTQRPARGSGDDVEELHGRLERLGYRHVSLELRAQSARGRKDMVGELSAHHALTEILPAGSVSSGSLRRQAELAAQMWQLDAAHELYQRLPQSTADPNTAGAREAIAAKLAAIHGGPHVIQSDLPVAVLVQAATVLGRPIQGRYCLDTWRSFEGTGVTVSNDGFIARCRELRSEPRWSGLPDAVCERTNMISADRIEQADLIVFRSDDGFSLGVKLVGDARHYLVELYVLFDCGSAAGDEQVILRNRRCLAAVRQAEGTAALLMRRLFDIRDMVFAAMRRILAQARGARRDPLGGGT